MNDDRRTGQTKWNQCIGNVKDINVYYLLIILMTWVDELTVRIMDLEDDVRDFMNEPKEGTESE